MDSDRKSLALPILLIGLGIGWLLSAMDLMPGIDWVWSVGLATIGVLTFLVGGVDKVTVAIGPFFLLASLLSLMRQTGRLKMDIEIPILVIAAGLLLLIARHPAIPSPRWMVPPRGPRTGE